MTWIDNERGTLAVPTVFSALKKHLVFDVYLFLLSDVPFFFSAATTGTEEPTTAWCQGDTPKKSNIGPF